MFLNVVNHGFEDIDDETPSNEFTFGPLLGWDLYDPDNVTGGGEGNTYFIGTLTPQETSPGSGEYINFPGGSTEGQRVGLAFNFEGSGDGGEYGFEQTLTDNLQLNTSYTLSVDIGNIASGQSVAGDYYELDGFPGYRVDLMAGGSMIAQDLNTLNSIPEGEFQTSIVQISIGANHALAGQALGIRLVNLNDTTDVPSGSHLEVDFDNVILEAVAIPEVATWCLPVLIGFTVVGAGLRRRCRV